MKRLFKNMLPYWKSVLIILLLLMLKAAGDLALPEYTSNIIDTGIINSGVEHILPTKITESSFESAKLFMTEKEIEHFEEVYESDGDCYSLTVTDEKTLDELDDEFIIPIMMDYALSKKSSEEFKDMVPEELTGMPMDNPQTMAMVKEKLLEIRKEAEKEINKIGKDTLMSTGVAFAVEKSEEANVDVDTIQTDYLWSAGLKMLLAALIVALAEITVGFFASRVGAGIGMNLRRKVFRNVVGYSNNEIDKFSTASLITRTTNDVQQVQNMSIMLLRMALYAPIIGIGGVIKVFNTGASMAWVIGLGVLLITGVMGVLMAIAMPKFKIMQTLVDRINLVAREILTGIPVIRAFKREEKEEQRFDEANVALTKNMLFTNRVMTFLSPVMMLIMNGISVLVVWVASGFISEGTMQVGEMTAFITYAMQIVMSFLVLTMMSIMLPRAAVAANRIEEVIETESTLNNKENAVDLPEGRGVVEFKNVSFKYQNAESNVIENISFCAKPGETTAIIGSTGSGKSTLVNLIPRLYDVTEGTITVDGKDIRDITMKSLREQIGYVPQKGILFSGTIESNIRFGNKNATDEEVEKSAQIAQATEFIESKYDKYHSPIAQGGSNVSGGQKQRLSIARAIAKKPQIYIFDDSFSALDMKTDADLRKALKENVKDSTVIIVAQRISTIMNAEQIIVLDEGKIAGMGTHKELLKNCEEYLEIAKSQLSASELEKEVQ